MAIQFRTRTKSTIDYSSDLKSTGVCCDVNGNKSTKTFLECFQSGGNFRYGNIGEVECPRGGETGCCCACNSYFTDPASPTFATGIYEQLTCGSVINTTKGLENGISKCECERRGGKWSAGACPSTLVFDQNQSGQLVPTSDATALSYCSRNFAAEELEDTDCVFDVRVPRSCCYMERNDENVPQKVVCKNVCRSADCVGYTFSGEPAVFSKSKLCDKNILGNGLADCGSSNLASLFATGTPLFENFQHGPCFTLKKTNNTYSYNCEFKSEELCEGYWTPMLDDMKVCNHNYAPQIPVKSGSRIIEPETISEVVFDSFELLPGSLYKGGIFVGKFEPGSPITPSGSSIYGSKNSSQTTAQIYNSDANGVGEKNNKKWILIAEPNVYTTKFLDTGEILSTSYTSFSDYDGFYNLYGDNKRFNGMKTKLSNTICGKDRKGFVDFYLPSIKELQFFANQYRINTRLFQKHINLRGSFMSSTMKNEKLLYTQYLSLNDSNNYGRIILSTLNTKLSILFFRKILLT